MEPNVYFYSDTIGKQTGDVPVILTEEGVTIESIFLVLVKNEKIKEFFS